MDCQRCRSENSPKSRFCVACGAPLAARCGSCSAELPARAKFCPDCGVRSGEEPASQSSTAEPAPADREATRDLAERRHVTVLFCDLVGSTELATELDPEDLRRVMRAYQAAGVSVIARFDGHVAQYLGDGLLVYFGYPTAHEDDAERAIRAGLGILEAIGRVNPDLERGHGVRLAARIGIHTGLVVAGEVGAGGRLERLALGGAPNVAARLKDVAMPDTVVISEETHSLVDGYFDMRDLGIHQLRGTGQATPVHQVVRERVARTRLDAAGSAGLTPLAGRDVEVRLLLDRWEKVKNGHGQVVLLGGEAGIGKSRLVRVIQEHVASDPNAWLTTCQASSYARNTAFHPIIDLLERVVLQFEPDEGPEPKLRKVEGWLVQSGLPPAETLPLMAGLLSLPPDPRYPAHLHDPEREKLKTRETLLRALLARASDRPVLFVLEDLHWADPSTIELMDLLVKSLADARILVVLTFRTEYVPPWAPRDDLTSLTLNRLERDPSALIAAWAAGASALPEALLQQVLARADGNPLFIEELSKLLRESGLVRQAEQSGSLPQLTIPATLRGSLAARLDRLGGAKTVAQIGAVLGREFSYDILRAVSEIDGQVLDGALDQLVNAEMLFQSGQPPTARYLFKHALIQEAAYDAILKSTRQNQHRRIAEVLTERFQHLIDKQPELIAHHYSEAGLHAKAIPYWQKAGQHALARAANQEAIAHLERALRQTSSLPEGASRDKLELELQNGLAPAYMAIKGWASLEVERTCRRARTLAELLGDFPSTYGSQWGLWTNYFLRGRLDEAIDTGRQVLQLAEKSGVPMLEVMACHAVAYSHFYRGEFLEARATAERGLRLFSFETEREMTLNHQFSSSAALRIILGCSQWMLGYPEQAPPIVASGVALTRELAHHPSHAYALAASLLLHAYRLDIEATAQTAEDLFRLAKQENFEIWTPFARMFQGWVLVERGELDRGLQETRRGIKMWQETGSYLNQTIAMAMLGLSLWKAGRPEEALTTLENEAFEAEGRSELHFAPELYRLKGEILLERAMLAESEASFERARALAHQQNARMLELRAATSLGRLWRQTGRAEAARQMVADLLAGFTEGFATPDLTAARALLDALGTGEDPAELGARRSV